MATFYNQATLSFRGQITNSNVASAEICDTIVMTKTALSSSYTTDGNVVYVINIKNTGNAINNASITDNLGAYNVGENTLYPLDYVDGSVKLFVNGVEVEAPTVSAGPPLVISNIEIPSDSNVQIYYEAKANNFAPRYEGASINNVVELIVDGQSIANDNATVITDSNTQLTIAKTICPSVICNNGQLSYTFVIQNSGNMEVVATDDVIISDVFDPKLSEIEVTYNGEIITAVYSAHTGGITANVENVF